MTELLEKMGPHDMGGDEAGPIDTVDHGMSHWEKHANAVRMTVSGKKLATLDEMRRACEDMGARYYELSYFERLTEALVIVLKEKNFFTEAKFNNKMINHRDQLLQHHARTIQSRAAAMTAVFMTVFLLCIEHVRAFANQYHISAHDTMVLASAASN